MNQVCCFTNMEEGVPGWEPSSDGEPYRMLSTCVGNKIKIKMTLNSGRRENGVRRGNSTHETNWMQRSGKYIYQYITKGNQGDFFKFRTSMVQW